MAYQQQQQQSPPPHPAGGAYVAAVAASPGNPATTTTTTATVGPDGRKRFTTTITRRISSPVPPVPPTAYTPPVLPGAVPGAAGPSTLLEVGGSGPKTHRPSQADIFHNAWGDHTGPAAPAAAAAAGGSSYTPNPPPNGTTPVAAAPWSSYFNASSYFPSSSASSSTPGSTTDTPSSSPWELFRRFSSKRTPSTQSVPHLSAGELPGAESVVPEDGRRIGPNQLDQLHPYNVLASCLSAMACLWIFIGMVLIVTVLVAATINIAYAAFHASEALFIWPLLLGLAFHVELVYMFSMSLLRTGARLMRYFWNAHYGKEAHSNIFPVNLVDNALFVLVVRLEELAKSLQLSKYGFPGMSNEQMEEERRNLIASAIADAVEEAHTEISEAIAPAAEPTVTGQPAVAEPVHHDTTRDPRSGLTEDEIERIEEKVDIWGYWIYFAFLLIVVGVPLLLICVVFPFWRVISILAIGGVLSSAIFIFTINILARVRRSLRVIDELWDDSKEVTDAQLRATYYASAGFDTGTDLLETTVSRGIKGATAILIFGVLFQTYSDDHSVIWVAAISLGLLWLCTLKPVKKYVFRFESKTFFQVESAGGLDDDEQDFALYNGALPWPAWFVFGVRCAMWIIGFGSLMYYDLEWRRRDTRSIERAASPLEIGVHRIGFFLFFVIAHDLALILPLVRHRTRENEFLHSIGHAKARVVLIVGLMAGIVLSALYARLRYPGFSSSVAVLLSVLLLSFRHPRCRWTNYQKNFKNLKFGREARLEKRAMTNAKLTLIVVVVLWVLAVNMSLFIGILHSTIPTAPSSNDTTLLSATQWSQPTSVGSFGLPRMPAIGVPANYNPQRRLAWKDRLRNPVQDSDSVFASLAGYRKPKPSICNVQVLASDLFTGQNAPSPLNVLDVSAFARGAYEASPEDADHQIHVYNRSSLAHWNVYNSTLGRKDSVQWVEYRFNATNKGMRDTPAKDISVVAVRGTSDLNDVFQDLYLWSTSALLQMSTYFGTLVNAWPAESVDRLASVIMAFGPVDSTLVYWNEVEAHVTRLLDANRTVLMTGHSLGGAIANIVAAHKSIPATLLLGPRPRLLDPPLRPVPLGPPAVYDERGPLARRRPTV
ncbi:hypothetical protein DFJ73DRAFT_764591 [Zopfochytrium polystomum]|nr:hypothetical protein DFJ73DRAFT_764591 [Zopfochytrium polystomum]